MYCKRFTGYRFCRISGVSLPPTVAQFGFSRTIELGTLFTRTVPTQFFCLQGPGRCGVQALRVRDTRCYHCSPGRQAGFGSYIVPSTHKQRNQLVHIGVMSVHVFGYRYSVFTFGQCCETGAGEAEIILRNRSRN